MTPRQNRSVAEDVRLHEDISLCSLKEFARKRKRDAVESDFDMSGNRTTPARGRRNISTPGSGRRRMLLKHPKTCPSGDLFLERMEADLSLLSTPRCISSHPGSRFGSRARSGGQYASQRSSTSFGDKFGSGSLHLSNVCFLDASC